VKVYCVDCDHVEPHSRKQASYRWLCLKFKQMPRGAVSPTILDVDPPYVRCVDVNNYNQCNQFERRTDDGLTEETE